MARCVRWCRYDQWDYQSALTWQKERVAAILRCAVLEESPGGCAWSGQSPSAHFDHVDHLLLLEHPAVYTIGRSGHRRDVLDAAWCTPPVPVVETDRGGQVTCHGPGQLVVYFIRDLRPHALARVRQHVNRLEETAIRTLAALGVAARRDPSHPGVWVDNAKVAALGVRIDRGVAYHGIAINRDPDLRLFRGIVPCGLADRPVTSLAELGVR
ncbi:MAG: lipoyl(octanoyl) transferase LipB, partial [Magnetococcus sp. DMHC-8]